MEQSGWEHNAHNPDRDADLTSPPFELKTTEFHNKKPGSTMPAGIPSIPNTNSTNNYPKDPGDPLNMPDGLLRGDNQEMAKSRGQWHHTTHEVTRNNRMASPAPKRASDSDGDRNRDDGDRDDMASSSNVDLT